MIVANNFGIHSYNSSLHNFTPVSLHVLSVVKPTFYLVFIYSSSANIWHAITMWFIVSSYF